MIPTKELTINKTTTIATARVAFGPATRLETNPRRNIIVSSMQAQGLQPLGLAVERSVRIETTFTGFHSMTMQVSHLVSALEPSATLAMAAKAKELTAAGKKVYDFSVGEPDFSTPAHICACRRRRHASRAYALHGSERNS